MFADLNRHAVKPTQSIGILYDHRDTMSKLTRDVIDRVSVFRDMVEKEKTSISNRSNKLFTLSGIHQANHVLLQKKAKKFQYSDADLKFVCDFWETVASTIPEWKLAQQRKIAAAELREDRVHAHAIALHALALAGYGPCKVQSFRLEDSTQANLKGRLVEVKHQTLGRPGVA